MFGWQAATAVAASAAILLTLLITLIFRRYFSSPKQGTPIREATATAPPPPPPPPEMSKPNIITRPNRHFFLNGSSTKPVFDWSNHPSLITDVVENGWSRFAFTNQTSHVETAWEVGKNSVELVQRIRMNPGLTEPSYKFASTAVKSVIKTALPLPGPNSSVFPQEAYFEITILNDCCSSDHKSMVEGEKIKLIRKFDRNRSSDSTIYLAGKSTNHALEERRLGSKGRGMMMCVGLTSSNFAPLIFPGSYSGSIGFNSDGSVYVDGIKLVFGSGKEEWGQKEKVIGCGFNPVHKKVFFTVDSKLAHVVNCKSEEFSNPLYPVIAANADITLIVNLGQTRFSYEPANAARTPNPCFWGSGISSPTGYEDSGELFSMGRIDSGWLNHCATKNSTNSDVYSMYSGTYNNGRCKTKAKEDEDESEADLFEIVLDVNGKSPKA